tara:strand:- start:358 stop:1209 length:852 start_codon:yes stop_codon:yes gene_type:complete
MNKRNPYDILGISSDSEMSVIEAAYKKYMNEAETSSAEDTEDKFRSELKWAYSELSDASKRNEYRVKKARMDDTPTNTANDEIHQESQNLPDENKSDVLSVLLSTGLFLMMIGAIGYGLYFVGAVNNNDDYFENTDSVIEPIESSGTPLSVLATEIPEISIMHTATVEALKATATREALLVYSEALTATNYALNMPSATPTEVLIRACPNAVSVNIRTGPSTSYTILGQLLKGDCVVVYGRNEESSWFVITESPRPSMNDGWVSSELIDMDSSGTELEVIYLD